MWTAEKKEVRMAYDGSMIPVLRPVHELFEIIVIVSKSRRRLDISSSHS